MKRVAVVLLCAAAGCEPDPVATQQWPRTPSYQQTYAAPGSGGPWAAPGPQPGTPPPEPQPNPYTSAWNAQRKLDLSLDVPPTVAGASIDVGDPWASYFETRDAPRAGSSPTTYLVVLLALDKKGNQGARAAAARKLLATRGAVKRSEMVWEFPAAQPDRTPAVIRAELTKLLCDEDHATLLFAEGRALAKVEFAGTNPCEPAGPPKAKAPRDPSEIQ